MFLYLTTNMLLRFFSAQSVLTPYLNQARWISQSIHPYISIQRVFYAGVPEARQAAGGDDVYVVI